MDKNKNLAPPKLTEIIWAFIVKRIGLKYSIIGFVVISLLFLGVKYLPDTLRFTTDVKNTFKQKYPAKPKFSAESFTIGVIVDSEDQEENSLFKTLKRKFHAFPAIKFHKIESFREGFNDKIYDQQGEAEKKILDWIGKTGVRGVIWGEAFDINGKSTYLVNWSHPIVQDYSNRKTYKFLRFSTTRFPSLDFQRIESILTVYIVELFKEHSIETGNPQEFSKEFIYNEGPNIKEIFKDVCGDIIPYANQDRNCQVLQKIRLELYMINKQTQEYFLSTDEIQRHTDWEFQSATGKNLGFPDAPIIPYDFQLYLLTLDYLFLKFQESYPDLEYFKTLKEWVDFRSSDFGLAVEREYPYFWDYTRFVKSQVNILECIYDDLWESDSTNVYKNRDKELKVGLASMENAVNQLSKYKEINDFHKGVFYNNLGILFLRSYLERKGSNLADTELLLKARGLFLKALKKLKWFQYRTPNYIMACKLNYARSIDLYPLSKQDMASLKKAKKYASNVITSSISIESYDLEEEARSVHSSLLSKIASKSRSGDITMHCEAVNEWVNALRVSPNIRMPLAPDTTISIILKRFHENASENEFEDCLSSLDYDFDLIIEDLRLTKY